MFAAAPPTSTTSASRPAPCTSHPGMPGRPAGGFAQWMSMPCAAPRGWVAVLLASDIPGANECSPSIGGDPILAEPEILFHGQVVFAVAATSRRDARRAARLAHIDVEEGTPAVDVEAGCPRRTAGAAPLRVPARAPHDCDRGEPSHLRRLSAHRRPGAFLPGGPGRARDTGGGRRYVPALLHPAPLGRAAPRGLHARGPARAGGVRVPPHGRGLRRQGITGRAVGLPRRARRACHRTAREGLPGPRRRHDHDRKASRLPGRVPLRHRRRGAPHRGGRGLRRPLRMLRGPVPRGRRFARCSTPTTPTTTRTRASTPAGFAPTPCRTPHFADSEVPRACSSPSG